MSYALIDNATLTAVQRVMGDVTVRNPDTVDGDIAALESFVQAILFYDELICIDNYKDEYQTARQQQFPFIRFLDPKQFNLQEIERQAAASAAAIRPEIRGGEFANDDFRELLGLLRMNMVCTWDMRSSVYYLTMKMLGEPNSPEYQKYSALNAAIFNELSDASETRGRWSEAVELYSSTGERHSPEQMSRDEKKANHGLGGTTRALQMFVASLNWLSYKTIYYSLVARTLQADAFLHPIRHAYQIHWMRKTLTYRSDFTAKLVESLASDISQSVSSVADNGRNVAISFDIPVFSAFFANRSGNARDVIKGALELKGSADFVEVRGLLREIRNAIEESGVAEANKSVQKWQAELKKASENLKVVYGLKTPQGIQLSKITTVYNGLASLAKWPQIPKLDFELPWPDFLRFKNDNGFANIYKDVTQELVALERLGSFRDVLSSSFQIDDEYYLPVKTEDPKFRRVSSHWKLPM